MYLQRTNLSIDCAQLTDFSLRFHYTKIIVYTEVHYDGNYNYKGKF